MEDGDKKTSTEQGTATGDAVPVAAGERGGRTAGAAVACISVEEQFRRSQRLSLMLRRAGLFQERATVLTSMLDFVESICLNLTGMYMSACCSLANGWPCDRDALNGYVQQPQWTCHPNTESVLAHVDGFCSCPGEKRLPLVDGRFVTVDAETYVPGSASPHRDGDPDYSLPCCTTRISKRLSDLLGPDQPMKPLILVQKPRQRGTQEMFLSWRLVKRQVMHQMNTIQGQLLMLLRMAFKRLLPYRNAPGLGSRHAKMLLLFVTHVHMPQEDENDAEETEPAISLRDIWQMKNLLGLVHEALQLMDSFLQTAPPPGRPRACMPNFFMAGRHLEFKGTAPVDACRTEIRRQLGRLMASPALVHALAVACTKPLTHYRFYFHPFTMMPPTPLLDNAGETWSLGTPRERRQLRTYTSVYANIRHCLHQLQGTSTEPADWSRFVRQLGGLPNWCKTARICLIVMALMKLGELTTAKELARNEMGHRVQRGWDRNVRLSGPKKGSASGPNCARSDWAWRYRYWLEDNWNGKGMDFLPEFTRSLLTPVRQSQQQQQQQQKEQQLPAGRWELRVNFCALWWSLLMELIPAEASSLLCSSSSSGGIRAELERDPDLDEWATLANYSDSLDQLALCSAKADALVAAGARSSRRCQLDTRRLRHIRRRLEQMRQQQADSGAAGDTAGNTAGDTAGDTDHDTARAVDGAHDAATTESVD